MRTLPVYVVGDNFAAMGQGWAEGALQTAEYMLQEAMGLKPPTWLNRTEYCQANIYWPKPRANYPDAS